MSTLAVVEEVLRTSGTPISVREIVERAGARLPSKSKTPDTVVARDLAMDIKRQGDASRFVRAAPGRYTLRELVAAPAPAVMTLAETTLTETPMTETPMAETPMNGTTPIAASALKQERAAALPAKRSEEILSRLSLRG